MKDNPAWPPKLRAKVLVCKLAGHPERNDGETRFTEGKWLWCIKCKFAARDIGNTDANDGYEGAMWLVPKRLTSDWISWQVKKRGL